MKNKKNIIWIFLIWIFLAVALLISVYFIYTKVIVNEEKDESSLVANVDIGTLGQEFISLVNKIKTIKIDTEFFNSAQFKKLKNFEPVFEYPKNVGRQDPFAPFEKTQSAEKVEKLED